MQDNNELAMDGEEWRKVQRDLNQNEYTTALKENNEIRAEKHGFVVLADHSGHELTEIAYYNGVDRDELSERMHQEARSLYNGDGAGDPWSVADPIVINEEANL